MKRDTFNGVSGYWENGAWFEDRIKPLPQHIIDIIERHTAPLDYQNARTIEQMSLEMERHFKEQRAMQAMCEADRKSTADAYLFVGFAIGIIIIFLIMYLSGVI